MRLVRVGQQAASELSPAQFESERELEDVIVASPHLLADDDEPAPAFVSRQVRLPQGGTLDVLLVDAGGLPIVAEAKLARNGQSRREVIGQVIDYVSTLTSLTVDELDQAVAGKLETALRSLTEDTSEIATKFDEYWRLVGSNLRAGLARYMIVVDAAPPELERIVRFLAERSSLNISLVRITKYRDADGGVVVASHHLVRSSRPEDTLPRALAHAPATLQAVIDAYDAIATENWFTRGRSSGYRQIRPPGWPGGIHYEFLHYKEGIGVELHIESDTAAYVAPVVQSFAGPARPSFPYSIEWDPKWSKRRGRIIVDVPRDTSPPAVAKIMQEFINLTHVGITTALVRDGSSQRPGK